MRTPYYFPVFLFFCFLITNLSAQVGSVGINNDGSSPESSAMLDVKSTTKGLLIPRMTSAERNAIVAPAKSLLVYDNDTRSFWYFDTTPGVWVELRSGNIKILADADGDTKIQVEKNTDEDIIRFDLAGQERMILIQNTNLQSRLEIGTGSNLAIGNNALLLNDPDYGEYNTAIGNLTLDANTVGDNNTAIGYSALTCNTTGTFNTANGSNALFSNTTGNDNTAIGRGTLFFNTTGNDNTASGYCALYNNSIGLSNTALGNASLYNNKANSRSTAVGYKSMYYADNTTVGDSTYNTAIGAEALKGNSNPANNTGKYNTALGDASLFSNAGGFGNIAAGVQALYSNISGSGNIAFGNGALWSNTSRSGLVAIGDSSLYANTSNGNTAVGYKSLRKNTTGDYNTANGYYALYNNTTGYGNTANGYATLYSNTTGDYNTAHGYYALFNNTYGNNNTANGYYALYNNTTGNLNTALGYSAFSNGASYTNSTALGYNAEPGASNTIRLGNNDVTWIGGHSAWNNTSDARVKKDITEDVKGIDFILRLRPVTFHFDKNKMDQITGTIDSSQYDEKYEVQSIKHSGFLAQEVELAAQQSGYDFSGVCKPKNDRKLYSMAYSDFVVPLVKAVQEQQEMIVSQQTEIDELKKIVQQQQVQISIMLGNNKATSASK